MIQLLLKISIKSCCKILALERLHIPRILADGSMWLKWSRSPWKVYLIRGKERNSLNMILENNARELRKQEFSCGIKIPSLYKELILIRGLSQLKYLFRMNKVRKSFFKPTKSNILDLDLIVTIEKWTSTQLNWSCRMMKKPRKKKTRNPNWN